MSTETSASTDASVDLVAADATDGDALRRARKQRHPLDIFREVDGQPERNCPDCRQWKPATREHFYRCGHTADGCTTRCRTCHNAHSNRYNRAYYAGNKAARDRLPSGLARMFARLDASPSVRQDEPESTVASIHAGNTDAMK